MLAILAGMILLPLALSVAVIAKLLAVTWEAPTLQGLTEQVGLGFLIGSSTALCEELVFRGFFLSVLCTRFSSLVALGLSSLLFGVLHLLNGAYQLPDLIWLISGGMFLGLLYLRTGSLWLSIGAHAGYWYGMGVLSAWNVNLALPSAWVLDLMLAFMFGIAALITCLLPLQTPRQTSLTGSAEPPEMSEKTAESWQRFFKG